MAELYGSIGQGYARHRRPDVRIRRTILRALDGLDSIVNVGAGTGSYEPRDRFVVAVEPSPVMIRQRPPHAAPVVQGSATALPFRDATFDASTAILTVHHWPDWRNGIRELARSARRRVAILTWDPSASAFWLVNDYFPEILRTDRQIFPAITMLARELGRIRVEAVPIPHDCTDGFLGAYWRRPAAYLDSSVRQAISTFNKVAAPEPGLARLRRDLRTGAWHRRHGDVLKHESLDLGYRLITTH
jgi:SAM-dependent methyltransferase